MPLHTVSLPVSSIVFKIIMNLFILCDTASGYGYANETFNVDVASCNNDEISQPPLYCPLPAPSSIGSEMDRTASLPPEGDIFSLSSSLTRSSRGSPVGDITEQYEIFCRHPVNENVSVDTLV